MFEAKKNIKFQVVSQPVFALKIVLQYFCDLPLLFCITLSPTGCLTLSLVFISPPVYGGINGLLSPIKLLHPGTASEHAAIIGKPKKERK